MYARTYVCVCIGQGSVRVLSNWALAVYKVSTNWIYYKLYQAYNGKIENRQ